jgi:ferredoxin-NADP reductase
MMSMVKACSRLNPKRPIWFLHGARDGQYHAFRDEVLNMAEQNPNLQVHFAYSRPRPEDTGRFQSTGYVDTALIQTLVGRDAEFFLCGSPPFLQSIREGLQTWGVPEDRVFFESFMKARTVSSETIAPAPAGGEAAEIIFTQSGKTLTWQAEYDSILEFAEANDLEPAYSCRQGICGTCMCKIREGEVAYQTEPTAAIAEGSVLICISKPKTARVVLEL